MFVEGPSLRYVSSMASEVESVLVAALRLSMEHRVALAAELIQSIDEPHDASEDVERAWVDEIQQRLADVDAGLVRPIPWPEARHRIFAAANGRRETR